MTDLSELWRFDLRRGNSPSPAQGACLLDAVSWLEYGTLGDHPPCVCPVLAAYGRAVNDRLPNEERQRLKAYIPRLVGTVDPDAERLRVEALARHAARVVLPLLADAVRLPELAAELRSLPADAPMDDVRRAAEAARPKLRAAAYAAADAAAAAAAAAAYAAAAAAAAAAAYAAADAAAYAAADAAAYAAAYAYAAAAAAADAAVAAAADAAAAAAADAATYADADADAAADAAAAARRPFHDAMIAGLDAALAIGRQADPVPVERFDAAVAAFAEARIVEGMS